METTKTITVNEYVYSELIRKEAQLEVIIRLAKHYDEALTSDAILAIVGETKEVINVMAKFKEEE